MPMWTGSPTERAAAQLQAARLARQIVDLLNQLDAIHPGSTSGQVVFLGGDIHARGGTWTTYTD